jgi:pre-mRNA-splicing helicase BRR2
MCSQPKKAYYSKFLHEPFPVESHLDHFLHDHFNAEIVTRTIETKQDAVDYLTWTYYYRRLTRNPNYYNLTGTSHRHVSDALSELVESTLSDLEVSKCAQIEDDDETGENEISPLNLGMIASYYYAQYTTVELFAASLTAKTKLKGILEIVSGASEFDSVPIRPGEAEIIRRVLNHSPIAMTNRKTNDPHVKTCALLQAHLSRVALPGDLARDLESILPTALRLLLAMVDVISSNGWLSPAMCAMELSQMLTQAMWDKDAGVLQLPHVTKSIALKAKDKDVESVYELLDAEDSVRGDILSDLSKRQLSDVAKAANRYPNVDCEHKVTNASQISTSSTIDVEVNVSREWEFGDSVSLLPPVNCSRYPIPREESWWVVVGDEKDNRLCAIKRVNLVKSSKVKLSFASPSEEGKRKYALYFMCDSYLGADLEFEFDVAVAKGEDEEEEDDSSEEEDEDEDEKDDAGKEKDAPDAVMKD